MGEHAKRLARFISKGHEFCAYCGGTRRAESIDHVPPTAFFRDKYRPPIFETPACRTCHEPFSSLDALFSLYAKLSLSEGNGDREEKHLNNLISSAARKFPDLVFSLATRAKDGHVKKNGIVIPAVIVAPVPTELVLAIAFMAARTTAALYYHKIGSPIPVGAAIHTFSFSASQMASKDFNSKIIFGLPEYGTVQQGKVEFSSQFEFRYLIDEGTRGFYAGFNFKRAFSAWGFIDTSLPDRPTDKMTFSVTSKGLRPANLDVFRLWQARGIFDKAEEHATQRGEN